MLLAAHQDVVPVPAPEQWQQPAFAGVVANAEVWGRGALDDKGSLVCILDAVESLLGEGFVPPRNVYLAFGHDEEIGGNAGARAIAETLAARGVRLDAVLDEGGASIHCPRASEATPSLHFARALAPELGFARRLPLANLWLIAPVIPWVSPDVPILDAMIRTTTAATIVRGGVKSNVLPREAEATLNFRILPGDSVESVLAHVRRSIDDARVSVELADAESANGASPVSPDTGPAYRGIARAALAVYPDADSAPFLVLGATDARHYAPFGDAVYRLLPFLLGDEASASRTEPTSASRSRICREACASTARG